MIIKMEVERNEVSNKEVYTRAPNDEPFQVVAGKRTSWMFIDDLHDIEVHDVQGDIILPDTMFDRFYLNVFRDIGTNIKILIKARSGTGLDVGIVCERMAYLLNDSGKTIERLK